MKAGCSLASAAFERIPRLPKFCSEFFYAFDAKRMSAVQIAVNRIRLANGANCRLSQFVDLRTNENFKIVHGDELKVNIRSYCLGRFVDFRHEFVNFSILRERYLVDFLATFLTSGVLERAY